MKIQLLVNQLIESANHHCPGPGADKVVQSEVKLNFFHQQFFKLSKGGLHHVQSGSRIQSARYERCSQHDGLATDGYYHSPLMFLSELYVEYVCIILFSNDVCI